MSTLRQSRGPNPASIKPQLFAYGTAIVATLAATLLRLALTPLIGDTTVPFITFFPAVLVAAWYGGFRAAALSVLLSTAAADYFFVEPVRAFFLPSAVDQLALAIFLIVGFGIALLSHTQNRAELAERVQRQQLETTLASIGDAVIATDNKGSVIFMNQVAESLTGWKRNEAVGKSLESVFRIINEFTRDSVANPALRAIEQGRVVGLGNHTVLITKSGTEIPIDDTGSPIHDPEGQMVGAVLIFRDITERRRVERERELLAQQTRLLDSGFDAIIVRDPQDHVVSWNRVAEELYGWTAEEAVGQDVHVLLKTTFPKPLDEIARELDRNGRWQGELVHACKDGSSMIVLSHWILQRDEHSRFQSVLQINIDISDRKKAEAALRDQRELLRVTLSSIGDAVIATDTNGAVTFLNHVAETLTGWAAEEAIGRPLPDVFYIVNEQTRHSVENPALRAMREGNILGLAHHTLLVAKDGAERPIDDAASPIRDADGKIIGSVLIFRDITQRRLIEKQSEAAARVERQLAAIVQSSDDAIIATDFDLRISSWNQAAERMFGYAAAEAVGQSIRLIIPKDRFREEDDVMQKIQRGENVEHFETERLRKNGTQVPVSLSVSPIYGASGKVVGASKILRDITERKRAADAESRARRIAEEANRAKDEFLAMLSHELRNPLGSILGWAVLLRTGQMPRERTAQALEVIERNARVEAQLVESLLDLSRIAAGKLKLDTEPIDLSSVMYSAVDSLRPAADGKGVSVDLEAPQSPIVVIGDAGRLQQIFSNLLTNAVKFTSRGGHIRVQMTRAGSQARIRVIDDGEGIDADLLPHIFDRFRQAESAKTRIQGGLGLGLAIVRELVHAHGGNVVAESEGKGEGSTFTVTLPIPAVIPSHVETARMQSAGVEEEPSLSGLRVLVVDDDADARELVALALNSKDAIVEMASSSPEALDSIMRVNPDVMIADIGLPHEDGYALIQKLRTLEREQSRCRLAAIALTAYASAADRDQTLAAGYDLHLTKPLGPSELIQAVAKFRPAKDDQT